MAEPLTGYFVGRARRELRSGLSRVGGMVTMVHRDLSTTLLEDRLRSAAYAGGIDFSHEFPGRSWTITGNLLGSRVEGSTRAITAVQRTPNHYFQRPDADHLGVDTAATALSGYSAALTLNKQAGLHWLGQIAGAITAPEYEVNDLGFANRTDRRDLQAGITYREVRPGSFFRRWSLTGTFRNEMNFAGQTILRYANVAYQFTHLSFWGAALNVTRMFRANDDRSTRGGPAIVRPANTTIGINLATDGRKAVSIHAGGSVQRTEFMGHAYSATVSASVRPSSRWNLTITPRFLEIRVPAQYVTTVSDPLATATYGQGYIFAPLDQTEISVDLRFNYTFRPGLTLETYAQPLASAGDYGDPGQLTAPRTFDFAPHPGLPFDPDFNIRSLRGNAVLRWEWRPGSNLYLAWQHRRFGTIGAGDFDFGRDVGAIFTTPADNIFVVKASFWLNP